MHANQFSWAWPDLALCLPLKMAKFPFRTMDYIHGCQKIESTQKNHASRGLCEMPAHQVW